jgi:hypothetical protein
MRAASYHLATSNARSLDTRVEIRQREPAIFYIDTLPFRLSAGLTDSMNSSSLSISLTLNLGGRPAFLCCGVALASLNVYRTAFSIQPSCFEISFIFHPTSRRVRIRSRSSRESRLRGGVGGGSIVDSRRRGIGRRVNWKVEKPRIQARFKRGRFGGPLSRSTVENYPCNLRIFVHRAGHCPIGNTCQGNVYLLFF